MKKVFIFFRNLVLLIFLLGAPYSYAMFQGGFVSWFLFYSILPIGVYLLGLWLYPLKKWKIKRRIGKNIVQAGEELVIRIEIERKFPFPLSYCTIEEILPESLQKVDLGFKKYLYLENPERLLVKRKIKSLFSLWFKRKITVEYTLDHLPRGKHTLHLIKIKSSDIFGFIKKRDHFPLVDHLFVYPNRWELMKEKTNYNHYELSQIYNRFQHAQTNMAVGVREYSFGDKLSSIDWKKTAKSNMLMTKEFEREEQLKTYVLLDHSIRIHGNHLAFEGQVELTTSFVQHLIEERRNSDLFILGKVLKTYPITWQNKRMIEQHLMNLKPFNKEVPEKLFQQIFNKMKEKAQLVIITVKPSPKFIEFVQKIAHSKIDVHLYMFSMKSLGENQFLQSFSTENVNIEILRSDELKRSRLEVKFL